MKRTLTLAALFAAGCAAALSLGVTRASAWSPDNLPPGWHVVHSVTINAPPGSACLETYRIFTVNNSDFSAAFCTDSPTYQADFDGWIDARYTPPVTTTAAPTLPPVTTTIVITTTTPGATTTAAPPPDTNGGAPAPAPAPSPAPVATNTVTVTTTVSPVEQSLQAQIDALAAQIAALSNRVALVEKAGDAAWLAFRQAVEGGADPAAAADIARGTWLNAVYGLGDFAP